MKLGLGIDTGGTYTDAIIYNFETKEILCAAKSVTTHEHLEEGITNVIAQLPSELLKQVMQVSLSTTLATNACVEDKGARAQLFFIGGYKKIVDETGESYGLPPSSQIIFVPGGVGMDGTVKQEPDWEAFEQMCATAIPEVECAAVVDHLGIKNPVLEQRAKEIIQDKFGKQTVCGHELFSDLNYIQRGSSALLNAKLIPIIRDFLKAVSQSMERYGIQAPVVIVRSDATLMSREMSGERPVETLLCGPAASVIGGMNLTDETNCLVVDMGGTTTDVAVIQNGIPKKTLDGVSIGKWKTFVKSVYIDTFGLGGDSEIHLDREGNLQSGPLRVLPICVGSDRWPCIKEKLTRFVAEDRKTNFPLYQFYYLQHPIDPQDTFYNEIERKMVVALENGPLTIYELADAIGMSPYALKPQRLEQYGVIMRCGLTPTDFMHIRGEFDHFDCEASALAATLLARQLKCSIEELGERVYIKVCEVLYCNLVRIMMQNDDPTNFTNGMTDQLDRLIRKTYYDLLDGKTCMCGTKFTTPLSLVGIGAPIHVFLPRVAKLLGAKCVIPENAGVANAVGAIVGNVTASRQIMVKPQYDPDGINLYTVFSPYGNIVCEEYAQAIERGKVEAERWATEEAQKRGALGEIAITLSLDERSANINVGDTNSGSLFLETAITATAVSRIV